MTAPGLWNSTARLTHSSVKSMVYRRSSISLWLAALVAIASGPAGAVPAFARKYETSCQTCHTIFPKLSPFGEAFRRNGYHFPGVDSDYVKQATIPLGQEAQKGAFPQASWPGTLPGVPSIAVGFNGAAVVHPDPKSGGALADNGTGFSLQDIAAEGQLWAAGNFDDHSAFFGELVVSPDGANVEQASIILSDWLGPKHAVNLVVGKRMATTTSFGPHSSYVADTALTPLPVTALYGASTDSWTLTGNYGTAELNGMFGGRLDYSIGVSGGANIDLRPSQNYYAHVGFKLGGMRLDGENSNVTNAVKPWAETALTVYGFAYRSSSRFTNADGEPLSDVGLAAGGGVRAQWGSLELNAGLYQQRNDHAQSDGTGVLSLVQYNELSYVLFPWLVPVLRVEYLHLSAEGFDGVTDLRVTPGLMALVRPNLKDSLLGQIESASGAPPAGWSPAGGMAASADVPVSPEVESITLGVAYAF